MTIPKEFKICQFCQHFCWETDYDTDIRTDFCSIRSLNLGNKGGFQMKDHTSKGRKTYNSIKKGRKDVLPTGKCPKWNLADRDFKFEDGNMIKID